MADTNTEPDYKLYGGIAIGTAVLLGGGYLIFKKNGITFSDETLKKLNAFSILISIVYGFGGIYYYRESIKAGIAKAETIATNTV